MNDERHGDRQQVAVVGAGGRIGRAITAELLTRDIDIHAVVRDPSRHDLSPHPRLHVVRGDAQRPDELAKLLRNVDGLALAVTPFTAPPASFHGFDLDYYATIVTGIDGGWHRLHRRLVAVGLTATLSLDSGHAYRDDPALFPPELRPFAEAHARQHAALTTTTLDWAILAPPAGFGAEDRETAYQLAVEPLSRSEATAKLSYAVYARAVANELLRPTVHATRVAVLPTD